MSMHERKLDLPEMIKQSFSFILKKMRIIHKKQFIFSLFFSRTYFWGVQKTLSMLNERILLSTKTIVKLKENIHNFTLKIR